MSGRAIRHRAATAAALLGLTGLVTSGVLVVGAGPAASEQVRTETTLGGYSVETDAAPFKVLLDDPTLPIPRPPDSAVVEADPAYSHAVLDAGPVSRGVGAVLWPGALIGDGVGTITEGRMESYPLKAEARYPDKPYVKTQQDQGAFMRGEALGLDVKGTARFVPGDDPTGQLDLGLATSTSTATVKDGVAIGTSTSRVTDVSLLGGLVKVGSVSTTLTVRSNGTKGTSSGSTVVTGLTVGPYRMVVDDQGARIEGSPAPGSPPLPTGEGSPLEQLGITVSGVTQQATASSESATRDAKGLRITVDTKVLHDALTGNLPTPLRDAVYGVIAQTPSEIQGYLFYLVQTTPKITFILGAGQGRSAATLPLSFDFPPLPSFDGGVVPPPAVASGGTGSAPDLGGLAPVGTIDVPTAGGQGPAVAVDGLRSVSQSSTDPFSGIPAGLLLLAALSTGLAGWGLTRLRLLAFTATAAAGPCTGGASPSLPDLRGA